MIDLLHIVVNKGRGTLAQICLTLLNFDIPSPRTMFMCLKQVQNCPGQKPLSLRGRITVCMNFVLEGSCIQVNQFLELRITC